jgi:hypothetical protein
VQTRHLVVHHRDADGVFAAADVTMKHFGLLFSSLDFRPLLRLHGALIRSAVHLPAEAVARLLYAPLPRS